MPSTLQYLEQWDTDCTPPALPSGWGVSVSATFFTLTGSSVGVTPLSSPNIVENNGGAGSTTWATLTNSQPDLSSGNVNINGSAYFPLRVANAGFSVFARSNSYPSSYSSSKFYEFAIVGTGQSRISIINSGTITTIKSGTSTSFSTNCWYTISASLSGSSLSMIVQNITNSTWLNFVTGSWDSSPSGNTVLSIGDSTISGSGYTGISSFTDRYCYHDDMSLYNLTTASYMYSYENVNGVDSYGCSNSMIQNDQVSYQDIQLSQYLINTIESTQLIENPIALFLRFSSDSSSLSEAQYMFLVGMLFSTDQSSLSENQYKLVPYSLSVDMISGGDAVSYILILNIDSSLTNEQNLFSCKFFAVDQSLEGEVQLVIISGTASTNIYDKNVGTISEAALIKVTSGDTNSINESIFLLSTKFTSDKSSLTDNMLKQVYMDDFSTESESIHFISSQYSYESLYEKESILLSWTIIQVQQLLIMEAKLCKQLSLFLISNNR